MMTTHLTNLYVTVAMCLAVPGGSLAVAATPQAPAISEDARAAVAQMGKTLHRKEFSFRARTIRPYANENGAMLRIEHDFKVPVRRPDRMLIDANGDDGPVKLYTTARPSLLRSMPPAAGTALPVPDTIAMMMHVVMGRFGLDFPLADFLTDAPDKAFFQGVTSGREIKSTACMRSPSVLPAAGHRTGTLA